MQVPIEAAHGNGFQEDGMTAEGSVFEDESVRERQDRTATLRPGPSNFHQPYKERKSRRCGCPFKVQVLTPRDKGAFPWCVFRTYCHHKGQLFNVIHELQPWTTWTSDAA
jgi:hypothetical protein